MIVLHVKLRLELQIYRQKCSGDKTIAEQTQPWLRLLLDGLRQWVTGTHTLREVADAYAANARIGSCAKRATASGDALRHSGDLFE